MSSLTNGEWYPDDQIYYLPTNKIGISTIDPTEGIIAPFKGYDIQTIEVKPNDVLLLRISDHLDLGTCEAIQREMNETFPNNVTLLCNDHIFKGLTILRGNTAERIDDTVDIYSGVNVDKLFDEIMKGHPNDFLY